MKRTRLPFLAVSVAVAVALAVLLHDQIYDLVVVPASFFFWQVRMLFRAIPQYIVWTVLILYVAFQVAGQLLPGLGASSRRPAVSRRVNGPVVEAALWLRRARTSNYFKWQIANRLGRVSRRLDELHGLSRERVLPSQRVADFLNAGLGRSFVDFPGLKRWFERPGVTALDAQPFEVVNHLERKASVDWGDHADSV